MGHNQSTGRSSDPPWSTDAVELGPKSQDQTSSTAPLDPWAASSVLSERPFFFQIVLPDHPNR